MPKSLNVLKKDKRLVSEYKQTLAKSIIQASIVAFKHLSIDPSRDRQEDILDEENNEKIRL